MHALQTEKQPPRRHRTTIARTAKRIIQRAEGGSGGYYWTQKEIDSWHPDDLTALVQRVSKGDVQSMMIRGELCWHCEP
ncbi:hypothetical protein [Pseudomonas amygdali]|uniref:Uncharacterized protein n=1 Tax=Pseudomonas amygdali pv. lachrymans str. M301315 TaxID=629260 RepID=A0AAD0PVH3_PSEAV|nr:hypothetical protein [Pseudomonas amygdali]AXH59652.1 hypothetical protein PLA107_030985 [Pseudomonas amygdali pv. lachrymans str. M301315]